MNGMAATESFGAGSVSLSSRRAADVFEESLFGDEKIICVSGCGQCQTLLRFAEQEREAV